MLPYRNRVVVDGDACPVKTEIGRTVRSCGATALMVSSNAHALAREPQVEVVTVDAGPQSADLYIANVLTSRDVLVTGDYGLAAIGLARGSAVLTPRGHRITEADIDGLLAQRHESAKLRRGGLRTKGPKAFSSKDRVRFQQKLTQLLLEMQENRDR
ncbi:YaiI/YqxD family protein [Cohnella laeviribosi]|uniref:YaiI/YqxD family protein n=1 Tax=Cohnella laeviribosi TaxID=380174 RepID=UPI003D1FB080